MKTILLLDDRLEHSTALGKLLKGFGYKVITEQNPLSALSLIREGDGVDLVISEYRMREMDGLEFLAALKKISPALPLIMLTAYSSVEVYLKALNLGVYEYLNKPVAPKNMANIVRSAIEEAE
jgi:DNA-binding NtrC family response regulator